MVKLDFSGAAFEKLLTYVKNANRSLRELNISKNGFKSTQMLFLLEIIFENRKLEMLDLSWNAIQDNENTIVPDLFNEPKTAENTKDKKELEEYMKQKKAQEDAIGKFSIMSQAYFVDKLKTTKQLRREAADF